MNINFSNFFYSLKYESDDYIKKYSVGEIKNSQDFNLKTGKPRSISEGLYDTKIFGTLDKCVCGRIRYEGFCSYCKTEVKSKEVYLNQRAYYEFNYPYVLAFRLKILLNELFDLGIQLIEKKASSSFSTEETLILYIWSLEFSVNNSNIIKNNNENDESKIVYKLDNNFYLIVKYIDDNSIKSNIGLSGLLNLSNYSIKGKSLNFIKNFINKVLPIQSPALRPPKFARQDGKLLVTLPQIHIDYKMSIDVNNIIKSYEPDNSIDYATILALFNVIQHRIMYNSDLLKSSKQSLLRNTTNVRVGLSARANISPSDDLQLDEIGIPKSVLYLQLQHEIIEKLKLDPDTRISLNAEYYYNIQSKKAVDIMYDIIKNSVVLFKRSPVLFKFGVFAFKIVVIDSDYPVIKMHPNIASPFNADYDGDQMSIVNETDAFNARRLYQKMSPKHVWVYDKGGAPLWVPDHEILIGLFYCSFIKGVKTPKRFPSFKDVLEAIESNTIEIDEEIFIGRKRTSYGRHSLDLVLETPLDDIIGRGETINKNNISKIIGGLRYKPNRLEIINRLNKLSNEFATKIGIDTPPFEDLYLNISNDVKKLLNDINLTDEQKYTQINKLIEESIIENIKKLPSDNFYQLYKNSGRYKMQQLKGLYTPKAIIEQGVFDMGDNSIINGLSERDFFNSSYETKKVFDIKQKNVPVSGYNTRQISVLMNNIVYSPDESPYNGIVKIPKEDDIFNGRVLVKSDNKFNYYKSIVGRELTDKIYKDEIRSDLFINKIDIETGTTLETFPFLAQSLGMQVNETISQKLLGLKYGSILSYIEKEVTTALFDGKFLRIEDKFLYVEDSQGKEWRYLLTKSSTVPKELIKKIEFKKNDTLIISNNIKLTENDMSPITEFIGYQVAGEKKYKEIKSITYAIEDGVVSYVNKNIIISGIKQRINESYIYKYPDGWKVTYGDRVSSGVLNLKDILKYSTPSDIFYIFYKEFHDILSNRNGWGQKLYPEFLEPLFAIICSSPNKTIKNRQKTRTDIIDSMYGGSPKQAFREAVINTPLTNNISEQRFEGTFISDLILRLKN